jgi:hypothetical protein
MLDSSERESDVDVGLHRQHDRRRGWRPRGEAQAWTVIVQPPPLPPPAPMPPEGVCGPLPLNG